MAQIEGAEELSVWFQTLSIHWNEAIGTENSTQYLLRFLQDANRLFTVQGEGLEILRLCSRNEDFESVHARDMEGLGANIQLSLDSTTGVVFYLLTQHNSWGRFRQSLKTFVAIVTSHNVFPPFLQFIQAFGFKMHEDVHNWQGSRWHVPIAKHTNDFEICYNVQRVEINGRDRGDPWSLRQIGVYQKVNTVSRRSTWILSQLPKNMQQRLEQVIGDKRYRVGDACLDPVIPHVIFISSLVTNWREYIEYLNSRLGTLDEKACFARIGDIDDKSYRIVFEDVQDLQILRQKILRALSVLESSIDVLDGFRAYCQKLIDHNMTSFGEYGLAEVDIYARQVHWHQRETRRIAEYSLGTRKLLFTILNFQERKLLQETNQGIRASLNAIRDCASEIRRENQTFTSIAQHSRRESRQLKSLSMIATTYLPSTLVATIFSSNLLAVEPVGPNNNSTESYFKIHPQFWIFILTSVVLTGITMLYPLLRRA